MPKKKSRFPQLFLLLLEEFFVNINLPNLQFLRYGFCEGSSLAL
jgi:hypothetical protein